jgi:hypothetical protein
MGSAFIFFFRLFLDRASAANKVHDDGDQGKEQKQMDQKTADVKDKESA